MPRARKRRLALSLGLLAIFSAAGVARMVYAHTYPTNACTAHDIPCEPDNNDHTYCDVNLNGEWRTAWNNHVTYANSIGATEYRVRNVGACTSTTDLQLIVSNLQAGFWGLYMCDTFKAAGSGFECQQASVYTDLESIQNAFPTDSAKRLKAYEYNWCHEVGHSLGLFHGNTSSFNCMRSIGSMSLDTSQQSRYRTYSAEDIVHIKENLDNVL